MLSKSREVPERCCVWPPDFTERPPSNFLSSRLRQDHEFSRGPQVERGTTPDAGPDFDGVRNAREPGADEFSEIPPHDDIAITICVIEGPSKGLRYRLINLCITMGRIGGGADFEFDEPEATDVHCIIAARQNGVRLYVAPSVTNIYVNNQRVYTLELANMSTFRVGSSVLLVSVLPTNARKSDECRGREDALGEEH